MANIETTQDIADAEETDQEKNEKFLDEHH